MKLGRRGPFGKTLLFSFAYGIVALHLAVRYFFQDDTYEHDALCLIVLAPLGALTGFIAASWVHELAHFFTARAVGAYVRKIQIGSGDLVASFRIFGTPCEVLESLRSGAVFYYILSAKNAREKMALVTAAAPIASLLLFAISLDVVYVLHPLVSESPTIFYLFPFASGFVATCFSFLPGILIPYSYSYGGRRMETDALRLLTLPRLSDEKIAQMVATGQTTLAVDEEIDPATTSFAEALTRADKTPTDPRAISTAILFLRGQDDPRALDYFQRLEKLPVTGRERTRNIDQYITYCLERDRVRDFPDEMDRLSRELVMADPDSISVKGTRGCVLLDLGRPEQSVPMLEEVRVKSVNPVDLAYTHVFLALAAKAQGNLDLARGYAELAAQVDHPFYALGRISDLLPVK
jgi:hypothetical protein